MWSCRLYSRERRQAIGDVDLDVDGQRVNTDDGSGPDAGKQKRLGAELTGRIAGGRDGIASLERSV